MTTLVTGASGATGRLLVEELLKAGHKLKLIIRYESSIPTDWIDNENIKIIRTGITEMNFIEMADIIKDCDSIASCLGHNLTFKGIFGRPRRLVADAVKLICKTIEMNSPEKPVKFVLMNTVANENRDIEECIAIQDRIIMGILRIILPPQKDNEEAAEYLRIKVGQKNPFIEWAVLRPDSLINKEKVSEYSVHVSPVRSGIFNPGKTSRINVGNLMARLITDCELWNEWKGKMPVIYDE